MSYDVALYIDTGGPELHQLCDNINYTSNVWMMFREALEDHRGLEALDGVVAGTAIDDLDVAITDFELHQAKFAAMNPPNGWGNSDGALEFLRKIRAACAAHPKATVRVSA